MTRKPASASTGICFRHIHDESGNPCRSTTGSPSRGPSSTTWNDRPLLSVRVPGSDSSALLVDEREPALVLVDLTAGRPEERLLDLLGDGSPAIGPDRPVVDLPDRAHLGRSTRVERLVGRVQVRPDQLPLVNLVPEVAGDGDDGFAGDAVQTPRREWRGEKKPPPGPEDILSRARAPRPPG